MKDYNDLRFLKELNPDLLSDFLKLIALDIKMLQSDRNATNITFQKDANGKYMLSPAYDFEEAYTNNFDLYYNPFLILWMYPKYFNEFIKKHEEIIYTFNILKRIKIDDILREIERKYKIELSKDELSFYRETDKKINKFLSKI